MGGTTREEGSLRSRWSYCSLITIVIVAFHVPGIWMLLFLQFPKQGTGGLGNALFNLFLVLIWGVVHSLLARGFTQRFIARWSGDDFVKVVFTVVAGITQCLMLYLWRPLGGTLWQTEGVLYGVLTFLFACSFGFVFYGSVLLDYMEVLGVRNIQQHFRKQPAPLPSLCLRGPYRHCRHPVYLATLLSFWIGPVMTWARLEFAVLASLYILIGTKLEERDTRRVLGEAYDRYRENVPMWIPRLTPWDPRKDETQAR
jgi:hypothetical protein